MANSIKADVVLTYPTEAGDWKVLQLSKSEARYVQQALTLALGNGHSTDSVQLKDNPGAYAQ